MSIFKESFKKYVAQQLELRQNIIQTGNNGGGRMNTDTFTYTSAAGGKTITPDRGAYFTNTINRQCVIRMCSGADITDEGARTVLEDTEKHKIGSQIAKDYVLEGGIRHAENTSAAFTDPISVTSGELKSGWPKTQNAKNTAYGDVTTRSNSGEGYGIVPMPGITDATIKTKSAYGSIREAKINFVVHNQRQLEIVELLYMRPGINILLEWGWTAYIDNDGIRQTNFFPHIQEFWKKEGNLNLIQKEVINRKQKASGNYDGLLGMIKNFSYKARPDGGYDCSTEITALGEIIEALKGRKLEINEYSDDPDKAGTITKSGNYYDLLDITQRTKKLNKKKGTDLKQWNEEYYNHILYDTDEVDEFIYRMLLIRTFLDGQRHVTSYNVRIHNGEFNQKTLNEYATGKKKAGKSYSRAEDTKQKKYQAIVGIMLLKMFDLHEDTSQMDSTQKTELYNRQESYMKRILPGWNKGGAKNLTNHTTVNNYKDGYVNQVSLPVNYITWEGIVHIINKFVIERKQSENKYEPLVKLTTHHIYQEEKNPLFLTKPVNGKEVAHGAIVLPYTYCIPNFYMNGRVQKNYTLTQRWSNKSGKKTTAYFSAEDLMWRSMDPSVCLLPHNIRMNENRFNPLEDHKYLPPSPFIKMCYPEIPDQYLNEGMFNRNQSRKAIDAPDRTLFSIGRIMFQIDRVIDEYVKVGFDDVLEEERKWSIWWGLEQKEKRSLQSKKDFNLYKFLDKIWGNVNDACGGDHEFMLHVDHERPDLIRVIDTNVSKISENLFSSPSNIFSLNIQGNHSVVRDFTYNSLIPSSLSATIGVAMQNPDSIDDLDGATFAAMSKNIKSRFHPNNSKEATSPSPKLITKKAKYYDRQKELVENTHEKLVDIIGEHFCGGKSGNGAYGREFTDTGIKFTKMEFISKAKNYKKRLKRLLNDLGSLHSEDGTYTEGALKGEKYYKGFKNINYDSNVSAASVIPLKFNAKMDGIGGIVIGNIFQIDPTRLPRGYKNTGVGFVVMGEQQTITSGQDWTTVINGQLTLLPFSADQYTKIQDVKTTKTTETKKTTKDPVVTPSSCNRHEYYNIENDQCQKITLERGYSKWSKQVLELMIFFVEHCGCTPEGAAGLVGNMKYESAHKFTTDIVEYGRQDKIAFRNCDNTADISERYQNCHGGVGLVQWTGSRRTKLEEALGVPPYYGKGEKENKVAYKTALNNALYKINYGPKKGTTYDHGYNFYLGKTGILSQAAYAWDEINKSYKPSLNAITTSTDAAQAAIDFVIDYERPGSYLKSFEHPNQKQAESRRKTYRNKSKNKNKTIDDQYFKDDWLKTKQQRGSAANLALAMYNLHVAPITTLPPSI